MLASERREDFLARRDRLLGGQEFRGQPGRPLRQRTIPFGFERLRLQRREGLLHLPMAILVVGALGHGQRRLQLGERRFERHPPLAQGGGIAQRRLEPVRHRGRRLRGRFRRHPLPLEFLELRRLVLQLLDPLPVEMAVELDLFDLAAEHRQHRLEVRAQRARAGRADAVLAGRRDAVELLLQVLVLVEERLALGSGVLQVADPRRAALLDLLGDGHRRGAARRRLRTRGFHLRRARQRRDPLVEVRQVGPGRLELGVQRGAVRRRREEPLQRLMLGPERKERRQFLGERGQVRLGLQRLRDLPIEVARPLLRGRDLVLGHPEVSLQRLHPSAQLLQGVPARRELGQPRRGETMRLLGPGLARPRGGDEARHPLFLHLELSRVRKRRLHHRQSRAELAARLLEPVLRHTEPLESEHARRGTVRAPAPTWPP